MPSLPDLAAVDGRLMARSQAVVEATDEGLLRGDGAFEVARLYGGVPFAWREHVERLERSCAALRLALDPEALERETRTLLAEAPGLDALLRVVITRAGRRLLLIEPLRPGRDTLRLAVVQHEPTPLLAGVKSLSYAANMLANRIAVERGYDEALFVSLSDMVLEGPTFAFFWVEGGRIYAPPLADGILDSITRRCVLSANEVVLEHCPLERLRGAEEAFAAGTGIEVAPVLAIEGLREWDEPGPVTLAAQAATRAQIAVELDESRQAVSSAGP
ncbi:MAG: branched-chain amino acid aminotransferase [Thermoleophilaceae bacterium]|nr:branched-chain amino acid aminotransferase [Thermoleophilaceae bacterium]